MATRFKWFKKIKGDLIEISKDDYFDEMGFQIFWYGYTLSEPIENGLILILD